MINKSITQISETLFFVVFFLNLDIGLSGIFLFVLCIFYLAYFIFSNFFHHLQNQITKQLGIKEKNVNRSINSKQPFTFPPNLYILLPN